MKCSIKIVMILCIVQNIYSVPVQNGLTYYRAPAFSGYYKQYPIHQTMLLHYNNPYSARTSQASEVTAFASGDRIGTGTYYQDVREPTQGIQPPPPPCCLQQSTDLPQPSSNESNNGNAISVAEAYPEEEEEDESTQDTAFNQQQDVLFEPTPTVSYEPLPQQSPQPVKPILTVSYEPLPQQSPQPAKPIIDVSSEPVPQQSPQPAKPINDVSYEPLPKQQPQPAKPIIEVSYKPLPKQSPQPAKPILASPPKTNVEIENNEDDDNDFVPVDNKVQRPGSEQGSWPLNNFFPISFGSTTGGAIAIANSFSTGKGGTAVSRATAYGSSSKQKLKKRLSE